MANKPRFLDLVREPIRVKHYSIRTEDAYVVWIKRFIFFHKSNDRNTTLLINIY